MSLSFSLAAPKYLRKEEKKVGGGRRSIVEADTRSAATCMEIPEDILMEILVRLPVVSLMRFKCVSRFWFSLISSRDFTNLFFNFSSSTKRRVFAYLDDNYMLFSSSLSNLCPTASTVQLNHDLTFPGIKGLEFVNALRGLMCFRVGREIQIINLTTRQVLSLPLVNSSMLLDCDLSTMWNYFGYDHVNDEYKVLTIISSKKRIRSECQILVLGAGASWRNTKIRSSPPPPPPHRPHNQFYCPLPPPHQAYCTSQRIDSINIHSFLYYGALSHEERCVLVSFDFNSEEFNLIEYPIETLKYWSIGATTSVKLMNHQGQVALLVLDCYLRNTEYILDFWVLEETGKSKWSRKFYVLHYGRLREICSNPKFRVRGTGRSGEITLSRTYASRYNKSIHAIYNLETNHITRCFNIETTYPRLGYHETNCWVDVESIMYLEA